jgi:hypothetical protein
MAEEEEKDNAVRKRTNLSIPLLPEKEEDKKLAALLTYTAPDCKWACTSHTQRIIMHSKPDSLNHTLFIHTISQASAHTHTTFS